MRISMLLCFILMAFAVSSEPKSNEPVSPVTSITVKSDKLTIVFDNKDHQFTEAEVNEITDIIQRTTTEVRGLLPQLSDSIEVQVNTISRNLDMVGGVFGRAEAPGVVSIFLSTASKGGISGAAQAALRACIFHEYHHLAVGWTMVENKYGNPSGIPIAAVNEGLASVFAETYTDQYFPKAMDYPENVAEWFPEVMALPKDANYGHWVGGLHPDGRSVIGYRLGRFIVHQAAEASGKNIQQLTMMHPNEILEIASEVIASK